MRMPKVSANQRNGNTGIDQFLKAFVAEPGSARSDYDPIDSMIGQRIKCLHIFLGAMLADADKESVATLLENFAYPAA